MEDIFVISGVFIQHGLNTAYSSLTFSFYAPFFNNRAILPFFVIFEKDSQQKWLTVFKMKIDQLIISFLFKFNSRLIAPSFVISDKTCHPRLTR